jgi:hypothetical protein
MLAFGSKPPLNRYHNTTRFVIICHNPGRKSDKNEIESRLSTTIERNYIARKIARSVNVKLDQLWNCQTIDRSSTCTQTRRYRPGEPNQLSSSWQAFKHRLMSTNKHTTLFQWKRAMKPVMAECDNTCFQPAINPAALAKVKFDNDLNGLWIVFKLTADLDETLGKRI